MIELSRTWVQVFRGIDDMEDFEIREDQGQRPDDVPWWDSHQREIGFFFNAVQEMNLGYFEQGTAKGPLVFHTRRDFKRVLLKWWQPIILDI